MDIYILSQFIFFKFDIKKMDSRLKFSNSETVLFHSKLNMTVRQPSAQKLHAVKPLCFHQQI